MGKILDNRERIVNRYDEAVIYLYNLQKFGIKLGLSNIAFLSERLGNPTRKYKSIHVAGTNGKGSTSSIIASILKESGFKVGLFLSPHLSSFTERISINGVEISEDDVIEYTTFLKKVISEELSSPKPTFFEFVTAMAFYYFSVKEVDYAVFETGMGGRLDATNILQPIVSVITNISLEHTSFLGNTIYEIASEKGGIIKERTPVVTTTNGEALEVISKKAKEKQSKLHVYGEDFFCTSTTCKGGYPILQYKGYHCQDNLLLPLYGKYQIRNAAAAVRVCEILEKKGSLKKPFFRKGLANVSLPGRLEQVSEKPDIFIDGAHNPEAASALAEAIQKLFPEKKVILVAGFLSDKDITSMLIPLLKLSRFVILTQPKGDRSASPESIMNSIHERWSHKIFIFHTVSKALHFAIKEWKQEDLILATGSFYTAGEAKAVLQGEGILSGLRESLTS